MRRWTALLTAALLVFALAPTAAAGAGSGKRQDAETVPGSYIVVLDRGDPRAVASEHSRRHNAAVRHVYTTALRGYTSRMSERAAERVARDDRVAYVEPDGVVSIAHHQCGHTGGPPGSQPPPCEGGGDVHGTVTATDTGSGIEGATVAIAETGDSDTTQGDGGYRIGNVDAGTYTVTASAAGYESESHSVTVDGDTEVNFALQPDGGESGSDQVTPWGVKRIGAEGAHDGGHGGSGVSVYVIDTGIDADHVDLAPNLGEGRAVVSCRGGGCATSWDDDHGHGTHVAGTAGAADNPAAGGQVVGVAPEVTLHAVKVLASNGSGSLSDVIAGIDWVASHNTNRARVANMSFGGSGSKSGTCTDSGFQGSDSYHEAICNAKNAGVVFAVAAGNSGADAASSVPAAYDDAVITASATGCTLGGGDGQTCDGGTDDWPSWSNWGDAGADWTGNNSAPVAIAAPGVAVLSAWNDGGTHVGSGTSMASPHAAGAAALVLASQSQATDGTAFTNVRRWLLDRAEGTSAMANTSGNPHREDFLDVRSLQ